MYVDPRRKYDLRISEAQRLYLITALYQCQLQGYYGADAEGRKEIDMLHDMLAKDLQAEKAKLRVKFGELEFENGKLVKVGGQRPEYMIGHKLIQLCRELGELLYAHETTMHDLTA